MRRMFLVNTPRQWSTPRALRTRSRRATRRGGLILETEPPADDHPLVRAWRDPEHPAHERVILNPHAAFYCEEGLNEMRVKGSQNCRRALLGEPIRNVVN